MNFKLPPRAGFGSLEFLITLGVALALFALLMIARPWGTAPHAGETIGEPPRPTDTSAAELSTNTDIPPPHPITHHHPTQT